MDDVKKKILLVEDEDFIRDLYKRQIELGGFSVDAAAKGGEGLTFLKNNPYDLVLLDIMLPEVNGLDILREAKKDEKTKNIPVVLLTNLGQDSVKQEAMALGAKEYIIKATYTPDQLVKKIREILAL